MSAEEGKARFAVVVGALLSSVVLGLALLGLLPASKEEWRVAGLAVAATGFLGFLVFVLRRLLGQDRQRALARFARRQGFSLDPQRRAWHEAWHADFELFAGGGSVERWNVLMGTWRGMAAEVFDYESKPRAADEDEQASSSRTAATVLLPQDVPALILEPNRTNRPRQEGSFVTWYGAVDGEVELSDFQRRYVVLAEDNRAAGRLLHPDMETFLMTHWNISVQTVGRRAVFYADRLLRAHEVARLLDFAAGFCERIPDDLKTEQEPQGEQTR